MRLTPLPVTQNSSAAQDTASNSEELRAQAQNLKENVAHLVGLVQGAGNSVANTTTTTATNTAPAASAPAKVLKLEKKARPAPQPDPEVFSQGHRAERWSLQGRRRTRGQYQIPAAQSLRLRPDGTPAV